MNIKEQILSIAQVQELQELGFDVIKHSSLKSNGKQIIVKDDFYIGGAPLFPTMTIGDIIEILPEKIKTYSAIADKELYFYLRVTKSEVMYVPLIIDDSLFYNNEDKLINNLFKTLIWCIKEKHIEL